MIRRIAGLVLAACSIASPASALTWNWSFGTEAGTFETNGTATDITSATVANPANFLINFDPNLFLGYHELTGFTVTSSQIAGLVGEPFYVSPADINIGFKWDGQQVTDFFSNGPLGVNVFDIYSYETCAAPNERCAYFFSTQNFGAGLYSAPNFGQPISGSLVYYTGLSPSDNIELAVAPASATVPLPAGIWLLITALSGLVLTRARKA